MNHNILKRMMNAKGFTVERLAEASELSEATIKRARGGKKVSAETISAIASVLAVTVEELSNGVMSETQLARVQEIKAKLSFILLEFRHHFNVYVSTNESGRTAKLWRGETVTQKTEEAIKRASIVQADLYKDIREYDFLLRALLLSKELENYSFYYENFITAIDIRRGLSFSRSYAEFQRNKDFITAQYRESISTLQDYLQQ